MNQEVQEIHGYRILEKLGQGGMGAVYKVEKDKLIYALKTVLPNTLDMESLARFEREALAAAAVDKHPNIVSIHKLELNAQPPFILMDFVEGQSLDQWIVQDEPWPLEKVIQFLEPLAQALDHMHSKGVVHRDLKPANILIRSHDSLPLMTDFGLARKDSFSTLTKTGQVVGTPQYMSPEQLSDHKIGPQTDIWALTLIIFQLLSGGKLPFTGDTLVQLAHNILNNPPQLSALKDSQLTTIIERGLSKNSRDRYHSGQEFLEALKSPPKPSKKPPWLLLAVLATLLALIALGAWGVLKSEDTKSDKQASKALIQSVKDELAATEESFPRHFFDHVNSQFVSQSPLRPKARLESQRLRELEAKANKLFQQAQAAGKRGKTLKPFARMRDLAAAFAALETDNDQASGAVSEIEAANFLNAYFSLKKQSKGASEFVKYRPESKKWRPSWFLLRALCAQQTKKHSRVLEHLSALQREAPALFHSKLQAMLWRTKIQLIKKGGLKNPLSQFKVIFHYWRLKQVAPETAIPKKYREAFLEGGQLHFQSLYGQLDPLFFKNMQAAFDVTLSAAEHGIYLDTLDNSKNREALQTKGITEEALRKQPNDAPTLFWKAYVQRPYSRLRTENIPLDIILKDIDNALKANQPSFYKALLLSQRAQIRYEFVVKHQRQYSKKSTKLLKASLADLREASSLPHPRPYDLLRKKFQVLLKLYSGTQKLQARQAELHEILDQYLKSAEQFFHRTREKNGLGLSRARPPGVPFGRFNTQDLSIEEAEVMGAKARIFMELKEWSKAKEWNGKAFKQLHDYKTTDERIIILKKLKDVDQLKETKKTLQTIMKHDPHKQSALGSFLKSIDDIIQSLEKP